MTLCACLNLKGLASPRGGTAQRDLGLAAPGDSERRIALRRLEIGLGEVLTRRTLWLCALGVTGGYQRRLYGSPEAVSPYKVIHGYEHRKRRRRLAP